MTTDVGLVIAIVGSATGIIAVIVMLMLWLRGEANSDRRHFDEENKTLRREMIDIMRSIEEDGKIFREQWAAESKDFHGRLCAIEERRK